MSTPGFHLARVRAADDATLGPVLDQLTAVADACAHDLYGHTDLVDSTESVRVALVDATDYANVHLVAVLGEAPEGERDERGLPYATGEGEVVGRGEVGLPVNDNTTLAEMFVEVVPAHRRRGIGSALAQALLQYAEDAGRTTATSWSGHREEAGEQEESLTAPTGVGSLAVADPAVRFATGLGFVLEQTERHSQLDLPVEASVADPLREKALAASDGYEVLSWQGATPPEHREQMARLHQRMSVDIPTAGLDFEEQRWDVERVIRSDERMARRGYVVFTTVARHIASGELVAFTVLFGPQSKPEVVYQGDTLVHGDHRGHRLGLLVKLANLDLLLRERPDSRRIHTWNAGENRWMLAINVAMGFRRVATEGAWQLRLTSR
ncbi:GNAT family N-acetyltransferase [Desertihabitans aurantiacus]|uniref:GNAT family N-acetyltransferase n=1 Tax=Desertihabitans aurantiacus TaxID=2282477 RepID=UPI0013005DE2|nr:GNAT family N-acetyltransferase [Desertihabitans aurantiacus]